MESLITTILGEIGGSRMGHLVSLVAVVDEPSRLTAAEEPKPPALVRWLPWIGLLLFALLLNNFSRRARPAVNEMARQADHVTIESGKHAAEAAFMEGRLVLPNGETIFSVTFAQSLAEWLASRPNDLSRRFVFDVVEFESGSAAPTIRSQMIELRDLTSVLTAYPAVRIRLIGHSYGAGDEADNLRLAVERAERVKGVMVAAGIAAERIEVEGRGAAQTIVSDETEAGRAYNSRVELMVTAL